MIQNRSRIDIQKIQNNDVKKAVFKSLENIHAEKLFKNTGMKILLKPNALIAKPPERAATTHPDVLRAVIQWIKQFHPAIVYVCDSSGGRKPGITEESLNTSGIKEVCEKENVVCLPFEKTERMTYEVPEPLALKEITSSKLLREVDLIVNIPKIKTHGQCLLTCCVKNMFGTILVANKSKTHAQFPTIDKFSAALADIYSVSKPQLTIIDGYLCQEGNGPSSGDVVQMDLILTGYDPVALDTTVSKLIGLNPLNVVHIEKAEQKGLGTSDLKNIEFSGHKIYDVAKKFKKPTIKPISVPLPKWLAKYIGEILFKATVKFNSKKCRLCGTCWDNCPRDAISPPENIQKGETPIWHKKECITCFCCVELCEYEAVEFKINYVKNLLFSWVGLGFISFVIVLILVLIWIF